MADTAQTGGYGASSSSGAGGAREQAQDKAQQVAGQARDQAQQAAGQAKSMIRTEIDNRSRTAGRQVSEQASDLRTISEQLRSQGKEGPAKLADRIAERVDSAGRYLTESDGERILRDVEDFGRRNPWAVMAGGLALGLVASRFLKSSSRNRYERGHTTGSTYDTSGMLPERTGTPDYSAGTAGDPALPPEGDRFIR
jgi:uncharacterized protein YjbJ (UPF0337 family)